MPVACSVNSVELAFGVQFLCYAGYFEEASKSFFFSSSLSEE